MKTLEIYFFIVILLQNMFLPRRKEYSHGIDGNAHHQNRK